MSLPSKNQNADEKRAKRIVSDDALDLLSVQRTMQGDKQAFDSIVERYTPLFYSLACRMLGSNEEAEDAVQEIFLRAFYSLKSFRLSEKFFSWIYTIAINWLRSALRKKQRRITIQKAEQQKLVQALQEQQLCNDPCRQLVRQDIQKIIHDALTILKPKYREVFVLHHLEQMPICELANLLKIPEGTVKIRLFRARNKLLNYLKNRYFNET